MKQFFHYYARMGLPVFPLCPHDHAGMSPHHLHHCKSPGKRPLISRWQHAVVPTAEIIEHWFRKWPHLNIGLALGRVSGIVAIDVDGEQGAEFLNQISGGDLPKTGLFSTPGGGLRYLFQIKKNLTYKKYVTADKHLVHNECALLGDGCQTVLPPSIHHTGGTYKWITLPNFKNLN
jgi:hypothetical protein